MSATLALLVIFAFVIYYKLIRRSPFWNIPGPKSSSYLLGHAWDMFHKPTGVSELEWQDKYGSVVHLKGPFGTEQLMITDPKALYHIFQETDYIWRKSSSRKELSRLTSGRGLAWADGDIHKRQRKLMMPAFGAPEAKHYLPYFTACAATASHLYSNVQLCERWSDILSTSPEQTEVLNIAEWTTRFALDALGQAAFDYDFGAIKDEEGSELGKLYQGMMAKSFGMPSMATLLGLELFRFIPSRIMEFWNDHDPRYKLLHRVAQVATTTAQHLISMKSAAVSENKNKRDVMSILVKANMDAKSSNARLTEEEIWASIRVLIFAGHETTANSLSWMLYELARHPELQQRVRAEVWGMQRKLMSRDTDTNITMQELESMSLFNATVKEGLRFHPPNPLMARTSTEDDVLPLSKPIRTTTGEVLHEIGVSKGTTVIASVAAYNRNPDVFGKDASVFNPERWLRPKLAESSGASFGVYANLGTFSAGIRSCIGWRFAVLEIQTLLYELLLNFEFHATAETDDIRRVTAFIMIPALKAELRKGSQMPLRVSFASRADQEELK
ncbi:hypothetical protein D9757_011973 [Collybiopsis confluens]|uniref:Cytochrome P450 n=1 Tax=Collybiopsis confluens TaxID=2823264 RepID=A0A8H5LP79_9AGAR|nr:hypothetical protein D9757_011973 [Collybiopsis confluens]